jgi:patatin-like phospholipase/acyl hydrolase
MARPRRLLALDGGGIRGVIAAEVLTGIEEILITEDSPGSAWETTSILSAAPAPGPFWRPVWPRA